MKLLGKLITHIGLITRTIRLVYATTRENGKVSNNEQDSSFQRF